MRSGLKLFQSIILVVLLVLQMNIANADSNKTPWNERKFDVFGMGNAMIDVYEQISDEDFKRLLAIPLGVKKGDMIYIDKATANDLQSKMKNPKLIPGGSIANLIVNTSSLGAKTAFTPIVSDDELGVLFNKGLLDAGVIPRASPKHSDAETARTLIYITPEGERTMFTYIGVAETLNQKDVKYHDIKDYKVLYIGGGIWDHDGPRAKAAVRAFNVAKKVGTKRAFCLLDAFYANKYRKEYMRFIPDIDVLFSNEKEAMTLFQVDTLEEAIKKYQENVKLGIITKGSKGALIVTKDEVIEIPAILKPDQVLDTTGAGDAFASGFMFGYTQGKSLKESGEMGAVVAAYMIQRVGARSDEKLSEVIKF